MDPAWLTLSAANVEAINEGTKPIYIVTKQFKEFYMQIGGSGATLPLSILLVTSKSKLLKMLGVLALPATLFNINEPIMFGLPIVLNMKLVIPWLMMTPLMGLFSCLAMSFGLVQLTSGISIPWTMPILFSVFFISGWSGVFLQIILFILGILVYYPFFKRLEQEKITEEMNGLTIH